MSNATQGILTVVGAIAGFAIGGVQGAYYGASLGYAAGNIIDPTELPTVYGPRLEDKTIQTSQYGSPIAKIHGSVRIAGNLIWAADMKETRHERTEGGKGGAPEQTIVTYTYSRSFAVGICEGEISSIGKVWANGKLIGSPTTVYTGTETQLPDPVMEAVEGVGKVPAYRGLAYAVFEDFQLADYGNRLPNLEFEVIKTATDLGTVVSDICTDAGVSSADIDVAGLTADTVDGYIISNNTSPRAALEPLMQAYQFDVAEIDDKLKFVKRGGSSVAALTESELSAHESGTLGGPPLATVLAQETDLPGAVSIKYSDNGTDYQVNEQQVTRIKY